MVAAILHGSLVLGDFVSGRSDIDLLVIVDAPLVDDERQAVQKMGARWCSGSPQAIDVRVVTRPAAIQPARMPEMELYIGCHRRAVEMMPRGREPDLLVELSVVRAHGRSLVGPVPRSVVGEVPTRWIIEDGDEQLGRWQRLTDDERHAELMVLTACRIWRFAVEGVHCSKTEAGRWALARDATLTAVTEALGRRAGNDVTIGAEGIGRVLAHARAEIAPLLLDQ